MTEGVPATRLKRSTSQVRELMEQTCDLHFFAQLRRELDNALWRTVHAALCKEMQILQAEHGAQLFNGLRSLHAPILLLDGHLALLGFQPPDVCKATEILRIGKGECISAPSLTWLQPAIFTAIAQSTIRYAQLPPAVYDRVIKMPHLLMLTRRAKLIQSLPLLNSCEGLVCRALAQAASAERHRPNTLVLEEGCTCAGLHLLVEGTASPYAYVVGVPSALHRAAPRTGHFSKHACTHKLANRMGSSSYCESRLECAQKHVARFSKSNAASSGMPSARMCCSRAG